MSLALNRKRRIVLVVYLLTMAGASAYVPWVFPGASTKYSAGYHWLTKMEETGGAPSLSKYPVYNPNSESYTNYLNAWQKYSDSIEARFRHNHWMGAIDYGRLAIEYIAITATFLALFVALPNRPRKSDSAEPNP